jgi:SpoVK/Ycf46/Vps4 family AAA+-type ATPase
MITLFVKLLSLYVELHLIVITGVDYSDFFIAARPRAQIAGVVSNIRTLAEGFSGAETVSICQEGAMLATEENVLAECVSQKHFLEGVKIITPSITCEVIKFYEDFGAANSTK